MSANKLKNQVFEYMRDEYGAICVRINSGQSRGYVASNHWFMPTDGAGYLAEMGTIPASKIDKYMPSKKQTTGFPDTLFLMPGGAVVFIELKAGNDKLSEAQTVFLEVARSMNHIALAVSSVDELREWLDSYGIEPLYKVRW